MALKEGMIVEGPGIKIRITDPNPEAPKAVLVEHAARLAPLILAPEITFTPLNKSKREWMTEGGFILRDWHGDGSVVDLDYWNA